MDVNLNSDVSNVYYEKDRNNSLEQVPKKQDTKNADASSSDALNSYGRAMLNLPNTIKVQNSNPSNVSNDNTVNSDNAALSSPLSEIESKFIEKGVPQDILEAGKSRINPDEYNRVLSILDSSFGYLFEENADFDESDVANEVDFLTGIFKNISQASVDFVFDESKGLDDYDITEYLHNLNEYNIDLAEQLYTDSSLVSDLSSIPYLIEPVSDENASFAKRLYLDKTLDMSIESKYGIVDKTNKANVALAEKLCFERELNVPEEDIKDILKYANEDNIALTEQLCKYAFSDDLGLHSGFFWDGATSWDCGKKIKNLLRNTKKEDIPFVSVLCDNKEFNFKIDDILTFRDVIDGHILEDAEKFISEAGTLGFPSGPLYAILKGDISYEDLKKLQQTMDKELIDSMTVADFQIAPKFSMLYNVSDINEIPIEDKKHTLRTLVECNTGMFDISDNMKKAFPLIPKNQEEYCSLLPALVRSLGIETNTLTEKQSEEFYDAAFNLANTLLNVSDDEFNRLVITQEYSRDDFISDTLDIVKDLSKSERQKVYDYFGFELHQNNTNPTGYTIAGYPVNLNNGQKLSKITNPETKAIVEKLRPNVIKFSENNRISCENKDIETYLNQIVNTFPEIRTQIDRRQHGVHSFDVFKHSLKVMQKIVQNQKYNSLDDSSKKILLLASLFHDGNKIEGTVNDTHTYDSAFDSYYITNKLQLPKDERIKLYTLINTHEWLKYVNRTDSEKERTERQQSVAFDLQYDNLFDLADIFTEADLKSIKDDDSFYNHFADDKNKVHSPKIREYINELKKSQPLLPVTKLPKASTVNQAITTVNADGSTNIKGVYKNKDGLVIIKFNEVEDWEAVGFPKGSLSKGIKAKGVSGTKNLSECDVDTGNIKFFAHALDYSNQLSKFDAFALPDSDALLSVSYTERPESKYRFFRTQGVLLDVDTKYVHGGGNTDAGSGCGKDINEFKRNYIFGGKRESDRLYVSNLIKEALNLSDDEYVEFVRQNANKSMLEINPPETREKIIRALATINSNKRKGNREYNEMYVSNPAVMGVFAYSSKEKAGDVVNFLEKTKKTNGFLQKYALENDMPFIVFGD